jgi:hypothetical protein
VETKIPSGLDSLAQSASKVKLQGGLAGKMCHVLIFMFLAMAVAAWSVKIVWVAAMAIGLMAVVALIVLWRLLNLAEKYPQSALMEGGELLQYAQLVIAKKGGPEILVLSTDAVKADGQKVITDQVQQEQLTPPLKLLPDDQQ